MSRYRAYKRTFPTDYDPEDCIWIPMPIALLPIVMGKVSELEYRSQWKKDDFDTAYIAIVDFEANIMACINLNQKLDQVLAALGYAAGLDADDPAYDPADTQRAALANLGFGDGLATESTLLDVLAKLGEIKIVGDDISLNITSLKNTTDNIRGDTLTMQASLTEIDGCVLGNTLRVQGAVTVTSGSITVNNLTILEDRATAIRNSIIPSGELYTLIEGKSFTFDDTDIIAAIEDGNTTLQQFGDMFRLFAPQNINELSSLVACCHMLAKKRPAAAIPPQVIVDDFGNREFVQPPGGIKWECEPPQNCEDDCPGTSFTFGTPETVVIYDSIAEKETEYRAIRCADVATSPDMCYEITSITTYPTLITEDEYTWRVHTISGYGQTVGIPGEVGRRYDAPDPSVVFFIYRVPLRERATNPTGAWVDLNDVPEDIGKMTACYKNCTAETGSAPDGGPTDQERRCKRARWFVNNAYDILSGGIDEARIQRDTILDLWGFIPDIDLLKGILGPIVKEYITAALAVFAGPHVAASYAAGTLILWITDRVIDNGDSQLLSDMDDMTEQLVCAVFNSTDYENLWTNWRGTIDGTSIDERNKYAIKELVTSGLTAWYYSFEGKEYIDKRTGDFSGDCSACSGWVT